MYSQTFNLAVFSPFSQGVTRRINVSFIDYSVNGLSMPLYINISGKITVDFTFKVRVIWHHTFGLKTNADVMFNFCGPFNYRFGW